MPSSRPLTRAAPTRPLKRRGTARPTRRSSTAPPHDRSTPMVKYTPGNNLPYPETGDTVRVASRDFRDLAVATDVALATLGQAAKWGKGDLSSTADLDTLTTAGTYGVVSLSITGRPPVAAYGEVTVTRAGVAVMQSYRTSQNPPQVWGRRGNGDGTNWGAWVRTDAGAASGGADLEPIMEQDRAIQ